MTQVSRIPIPVKLEQQIATLFQRVLTEVHSREHMTLFLEDLLTPTEKQMLGKRLAIAFLLEKGYDHRTIHKILKVSTTTVFLVNKVLQEKGNGYRTVIQMVRRDEKWVAFINSVDYGLEELFSPKAWHRRNFGAKPKE